MDELTLKIIKGDRVALNLVKTLVTTPTLINTDATQGPKYAIALAAETMQQSASAEVSDSLVVSRDAKEHVTDNVAPGPVTWNMTGYIPGIREFEPSNYFTPFVRLHTDILWQWYRQGAVLTFKDGNAKIYKQVVIKDFSTSMKADAANAVPFSMTLKEINVLDTSVLDELQDPGNTSRSVESICKIGSSLGLALGVGVMIATSVNTQKDEEAA